jgi:hypothetical protein
MKILSDRVSRTLGTVGLKLSEKSPHIMFGVGLVGVGAAAVLACRATLRLEETVDDIREDVDAVKEMGYKRVGRVNADQERAKDMVYVAGRSVIRIGQLYGPSLLVGGASVGLLIGGHYKLAKRNAALTTTLAAVTQAYAAYRERVRDVIGRDRELEIYHGVREIEVPTADGRLEIKKISDPTQMSLYAKLFDQNSKMWEPHPETNRLTLRGIQEGCNIDLRARGYLFLNDVYRRLGLPETTAGQIVGWQWNSKSGDNFVDFGYDGPHNEAFFNDDINEVWLDFNVDGPIHSSLGD